MKDYFLKLFGYDYHINKIIIDAIKEAGSPAKAVELMTHMLASQQVWLSRCQNDPTPRGPLWPDDGSVEKCCETYEQNHRDWLAFLQAETDFDQVITYKDTKGNTHSNTLTDILAHLINHGTHHRAQIGQQLKLAGLEKLPVTDYIFYIRGFK